MAVKLRLTRVGKKKQPFYRIVAIDSRKARNGKYIENIGYYNPMATPSEVVVNEERAHYWLDSGAVPTNTVKNLLSRKGIFLRRDLKGRNFDEARIEEEVKKWEVMQIEREKRREAAESQKVQERENKAKSEEVVSEKGGIEPVEEKAPRQEEPMLDAAVAELPPEPVSETAGEPEKGAEGGSPEQEEAQPGEKSGEATAVPEVVKEEAKTSGKKKGDKKKPLSSTP